MCNKHSNVFYGFIISNIGGKCFLPFLLKQVNSFLADKNTCVIIIMCLFIYLFIYFVPLGDGKMGRASQPLCTGAGVGGQT